MIIIKMDYEDIGLVCVRTTRKGKIRKNYIRYTVDEYSIDKAIKNSKTNKWVVALDYVGDYQYLFNIEEKPSIPVIVTKSFVDINELSITFFMKCLPDWVIVSIKTPEDFCDMRIVENLSLQFPNIRFCGGKFLRLPTCRIGCIQQEDLPKSVVESKVPYYTEGCACPLKSMHIDEVEDKELLFKDPDVEREIKKQETKKKVLNSIDDLFNV